MSHGFNSEASGSSKLIQLFARLPEKSKGIVWSKKHYKAVKDCKKCVTSKHNKHHGLLGEFFHLATRQLIKQ